MATASQTVGQSLRISVDDLKNQLAAERSVTILDARATKAWDSSNEKICGAIRVDPDHFQVDPSWPRDRLTVAYCT